MPAPPADRLLWAGAKQLSVNSVSTSINLGAWARRLPTPTPNFFSQFNTTSAQDWELEFRVTGNSYSQSKC